MEAVWKNWAHPKCKQFAWLILQDRIRTFDRLIEGGQIVVFANFVEESPNPRRTFFSSAAIHFRFGNLSSLGSG
jgi:hypothetical protein